MWLRELYSEILTSVRIGTYGNNAASKNATTEQDIRSISALLLCENVDVRRDEEVCFYIMFLQRLKQKVCPENAQAILDMN